MKKAKRKKPFPATRETIKHMESEGWTCWVVESRIPHTFITRDCFGFADVLAMSPTKGIMLIQVTGGSHFPDRLAKVRAEARHAIWLAAGGRIQIHSWEKRAVDPEGRAVSRGRSLRVFELTTWVGPGNPP